MRVLWLCNIMLPVIAERLGLAASNKEGWLAGLSSKICRARREEGREEGNGEPLTLGVCFPVTKAAASGEAEGIRYYGFLEDTRRPERYDPAVETHLKRILEDFKPDVVHCFGTEYPHTLAMTRAFGRPERTLIGIQGLCFAYADAYMADLPERIRKRTLFRDWLKRDDLLRQQRKYRERGVYEIQALKNTGHITGRTDWDKRLTEQVNPKARYHFLNETLREPFYGPEWSPAFCEKYSIFLSQGNYPIKGLHYMLEAMPEILREYPKARIYVAGDKITGYVSLKEKIKISNYGKYLLELIKKHDLEKAVVFLGKLDAERMRDRFLKSHVFVSPSSIENSPNSVGEAMLLGMPVISSDVGGVSNMLRDGQEGWLYPASDTRRLAELVRRAFDPAREEEILAAGRAARAHARMTHDPEINYRRLMEIYREINLCV